MSNPIGWCEKTWNPISGCSPISSGCTNCYAKRMATRLRGRCGYPADGSFRVTFHPERLEEPLKWRKPRRIFCCSMGDLFHKDVKDDWILRVWNIMRQCDRHRFMVLTKRPERMVDFVKRVRFDGQYGAGRMWLSTNPQKPEGGYSLGHRHLGCTGLTNVWLGVTAENQEEADRRVSHVLRVPASIRGVSVEPMLGPVDLRSYIQPEGQESCIHCGADETDVFTSDEAEKIERNEHGDALCKECGNTCDTVSYDGGLDWVIAGAETGPGKRRMDLDWARSLRDQCVAAGTAFYFKKDSDGNHALDGQVWEQFPEVKP